MPYRYVFDFCSQQTKTVQQSLIKVVGRQYLAFKSRAGYFKKECNFETGIGVCKACRKYKTSKCPRPVVPRKKS